MSRLSLALPIALILGLGYFWWKPAGTSSPNSLTLFGNIDIRQVQLSFRDTERIDQILVKEGETVQAGQLLAVQKLERFRLQRDAAAAKRDAQVHVVEKLLHGSRPQEIGIAGSEVKAARAALTLAEKELARIQALFEKKLAAPESLDQAETRRDEAKQQLAALREQLALAQIGPRNEDISAAKAQLQADQAATNLAEQILHDANLHAPQNAVVQNRILEVGDMAGPAIPVLTLALTDPVWARLYAAEADLGKLRPGLPATIHSDSFPEKSYPGWLGYISPSAEFTPKNVETPELRTSLVYQVRVYVCNPDAELRLGMPISVTVDTQRNDTAITECPDK